jgi:hypothetical protein
MEDTKKIIAVVRDVWASTNLSRRPLGASTIGVPAFGLVLNPGLKLFGGTAQHIAADPDRPRGSC